MKKSLSLLLLVALVSFGLHSQSCSNSPKNPSAENEQSSPVIDDQLLATNTKSTPVEAYYFHFTRRCVTCQAVETVTAEALKTLYGGKIVLKSINLDEKGHEALVKKLGINGQTLVVVKGTKKTELTNEGFMYARSNPEKLKEAIKKAVDAL